MLCATACGDERNENACREKASGGLARRRHHHRRRVKPRRRYVARMGNHRRAFRGGIAPSRISDGHQAAQHRLSADYLSVVVFGRRRYREMRP